MSGQAANLTRKEATALAKDTGHQLGRSDSKTNTGTVGYPLGRSDKSDSKIK
jgi:hypothetical protein